LEINMRNNQNGKPGDQKPYRVGNGCPPPEFHFVKGKSGNPRGRPKQKKTFDDYLLKELHKLVTVSIGGKTFKMNGFEAFSATTVKDGIAKGPQSKRLLSQRIDQLEARQAEERARSKNMKYMEEKEFVWSERQEKLFQELHDAEAAQKREDDLK
jgi:Family of unknown function (DUF5681)